MRNTRSGRIAGLDHDQVLGTPLLVAKPRQPDNMPLECRIHESEPAVDGKCRLSLPIQDINSATSTIPAFVE